MNLLVIANKYPMFDRASGDLRFYQILRMLAAKHDVAFCAFAHQMQTKQFGAEESRRYRQALTDLGIAISEAGPRPTFKNGHFDAVFFEFYFSAQRFLDDMRVYQPWALAVVDTVDVHFHRLFSKAQLTQRKEDWEEAEQMLRNELGVYRRCDLLITVSTNDRDTLLANDPSLPVEIIPNIHPMHSLGPPRHTIPPKLVFVGGFRHEPNIDAMLYFCREVLPLVSAEVPDVELAIIGDSPPDNVMELASDRITVLGYVPDTWPHLEASGISVAPLRYGAGVKGKVGEAMAAGLPVVTTSIGTEGFGLTHGENVMVGDTPQAFAEAVVRLLQDGHLYNRIRQNGWQFVHDAYSEEAVEKRVHEIIAHLDRYPVQRLSPITRLRKRVTNFISDQVAWRLSRKS